MIHKVIVDLSDLKSVVLELDDKLAPKTIKSFLDLLPFKVGINIWGEELYTNETSLKVGPENSKSLVDLMDGHIGLQERQFASSLVQPLLASKVRLSHILK